MYILNSDRADFIFEYDQNEYPIAEVFLLNLAVVGEFAGFEHIQGNSPEVYSSGPRIAIQLSYDKERYPTLNVFMNELRIIGEKIKFKIINACR